MLAIKECLIREGVLNLNTAPNLSSSPNLATSSHSQTHSSSYPLYRNHYSFGSHLDMMASSALVKKSVIDSSVNDLTSASATAKSSCQLQKQNPQPLQLQHPQTELQEQQQQSLLKKQQNFRRYQGHHPHFHHHTAPAYYTDLHLRIHTPEVKDSLNENYQSVYRTPSKLVKDERQFPKTATATVAPPPLNIKAAKEPSAEQQEGNSTTSSGSFFRGGGCGHSNEHEHPKSANDPYGTSSPNSANPAKGNSPQSSATVYLVGDELPLAANADGSVVFACTNFKPCVASELVQSPALASPKQSPSTGRSSRNPQRFNNRRRAVRVRSESRPISALYDIICKEKGLDIATTTTNDEDSSPHHSHDEKSSKSRRSHSRSVPKQAKASHNSSSNIMMSPGGDQPQVPRSTATALPHKKRSSDKYSSPNTTIFINDLSDNDDDDGGIVLLEGGCSRKNLRLRGSHKMANNLLSEMHQAKSSSLPPGLKGLSNFSLNAENHNNYQNHHHHPSSKVSQDSFKSLQTSSASDNVLNANYSSSATNKPAASSSSATTTTTNVHVEPPSSLHMHLSSSPVPAQPLEQSAASGAGNSTAAATVASPKAERFPRKYRRSRDEKPRRHTDGGGGAIQLLASSEQTNEQHLDDDDVYDDAGDQLLRQYHHQHQHDRHPHHQLYPQLHDLNGAGHDFHVLANAANAKRFITRSQRAKSAGINGLQPSDSSSSASNSPIPGRLSPPSIAPASSSLQQPKKQQQQKQEPTKQQQEIPLLSKSPTVTGKSQNGFIPTVKDMTNNSGGGVNVKHPTKSTSNAAGTATAKIKPNASDLKNQIPYNVETKTVLPSPAGGVTGVVSTAATPPPVISASSTTTTALTTPTTTTTTSTCPALQQRNFMEHQHIVQQKSPSKSNHHHPFGPCWPTSTSFNNNQHSINGNNNYATPTASSVLKQRMQTVNCLSPKYRKCPLSPLLITATNAPLFATTTPTITIPPHTPTSPSQHPRQTQPSPTNLLQQQPPGKLSPARSPILDSTNGTLMPSSATPLSPNSSLSVHLVRTTKTTRLRAAALDKKKDEENRQQQRFTSPTSPKQQPQPGQQLQRSGPSSDTNPSNKSPSGSEGEHPKPMPATSNSCSPTHRSKKLIPSVSVSVKQNLNEMHCTASRSNSIRSNASSPKSPKCKTPSVECTVRVPSSPKATQKQQTISKQHQTVMPPPPANLVDEIDDDFMEIHDLPMDGAMLRPRCSTMHNETNERTRSSCSSMAQSYEPSFELSPVHRSRHHDRSPRRNEDRDKSSKRKSNLNRSQNEEAIPDSDEAAMRRRKRRELGMARALVPNDDLAVKELITSPLKTQPISPLKPAIRNDLAYHMEMARRGLDLATTTTNVSPSRRRAQTASPKHVKETPSPSSSSSSKPQHMPRVNRRSDTVAIGELRKQRTDEVNRKMNERTRSDLADIIKIVEIANECSENAASAITDLTKTMNRLRTSQDREDCEDNHSSPSTGKHTTFHQEERIYYEPHPLEHMDVNGEVKERSKLGGILRSQRMLKAKSIERESSFEPPKLSPILRRKSTDDPFNTNLSQTPNQIVSILKKKDHLSAGESSSASSNASPVTFSANVMDTPSKSKRAGILKKRSSLDESRYYSRSHSPDERSIFIKSARRNSLEETAANGVIAACSLTQGPQGILKQSSYDSFKSDSCPSAGGAVGGSGGESQHPHSILKKKDSTSTPSDGATPKHVSISQAVTLAAAELSATEPGENAFNDELAYTPSNEEYDIKPILKLESTNNEEAFKPPKPILKKKSSGDSDEHEIKPILKTSRKSSREEFEFDPFSESDTQEPSVRPILKTDSPSKRRSLGGLELMEDRDNEREADSSLLLKRRTRSLERQDQTPVIDLGAALNAIATSHINTDDLVASLTSSTSGANISVADRIKSMEKYLNQTGPTTSGASAANTSWDSPLQNDPNTFAGAASAGSVGGGGAVKILKPSVIRRDLLKDRYKTQPVTSDEKNFFKNNDSSTLYTSPTGSAFKPAKSLEGLGFINITAHGNQSPNAPPSAFALTRSYTQPLQPFSHSLIGATSSPPQTSSSFKVSATRKTPNRSSLLQLNDTTANSNLTQSFTAGDSGLSCDSHSEQRIFEMSSLEHDVEMVENQEPKTPSNPDTSTSSGGGIVRTNSVRARANMFQQLQEKTGSGTGLNREERTSPRRVPRRLSPSPAPLNATNDEPRTPNNPPANPDEEIASSSSGLAPALEPPRGILKSKSSIGGMGFMPTDLSNELKNRLKSSQNASVTNLRKSATTSDAVRDLQQPAAMSASSSALASGQHDDTVSLVRNLTNLGKPPQLRDPMKTEPDIASASEGESSGGREISEIIKNSAVARRRKFNEGLNIAMKNHPLPPPATTSKFWPYKHVAPNHGQQQQQQQQQPQHQQQPLQPHNYQQQQQQPLQQSSSSYKYQKY